MDRHISKGDYVVATKWSDGHWDDQWCVGFYDGELEGGVGSKRHLVVDNEGVQFRCGGFRRVKKITRDQGSYILGNVGSFKSVWILLRSISANNAK